MKLIEDTTSICPGCMKKNKIQKIPAQIIEEKGKIYMEKKCKKHGLFKEILSTNSKQYKDYMKYFATGSGFSNPQNQGINCPEDCGLCKRHRTHTLLANIILTNRCNLRCSYCFANAGAAGFVYEPTKEEIRKQLKQLRDEKPVPCTAIQNTGGEPTIRSDLIDIIKMEKEMGFSHIQLNTNAVMFADNPQLAKDIREAGVNTIYMSFDGLTKKSNPWLEKNLKAIESFRKAGVGIVMVPTVIRGYNEDQVGDLLRFAMDNTDVIRGVNFQPVSFVGRIDNLPEKVRKEERITYSELLELVQKQTNGQIKINDWYPVPFVLPVSKLVEKLKGKPQIEFTCHPSCGGATYAFIVDGKLVPITNFVDVEGLMKFMSEVTEIEGFLKKPKMLAKLAKNIGKFIDKEKAPKGLDLGSMLINMFKKGSHKSLGKFHHKSLYIGSMWFQDSWNFNISRLERCAIHYTTPEGIIPFCAYNGLGYGQKIEKKHSISIKEWEKKNKANVNQLH